MAWKISGNSKKWGGHLKHDATAPDRTVNRPVHTRCGQVWSGAVISTTLRLAQELWYNKQENESQHNKMYIQMITVLLFSPLHTLFFISKLQSTQTSKNI